MQIMYFDRLWTAKWWKHDLTRYDHLSVHALGSFSTLASVCLYGVVLLYVGSFIFIVLFEKGVDSTGERYLLHKVFSLLCEKKILGNLIGHKMPF